MAASGVFHCPCHGSRFSLDGEALNGPAVLPLVRFGIRTAHGRLIVDPSQRAGLEDAEWDARFFVQL
jgi:Rieske Fe-S protein